MNTSELMPLIAREGMINVSYLIIKYGGSVVDKLPSEFYQKLAVIQKYYGIKPILVHGGGPMISSQLKQMDVTTTFVDGLRVTTDEVLDVVEMVLSGSINKRIVRQLHEHDIKAIGMSGVDGHLLQAEPVKEFRQIGYVGQVNQVNVSLLKTLLEQEYVPVISPLAIGAKQQRYNVNADTAASAIASALSAPLCFISDIPGICVDDQVIHSADQMTINRLIDSQTIYGGMIPKVKAALNALETGVPEVAILDGMNPASLEAFVNGECCGTRIKLKEVSHV